MLAWGKNAASGPQRKENVIDCAEELHSRKHKEAYMGVNSFVKIGGDPLLLNWEWQTCEKPLWFIWEPPLVYTVHIYTYILINATRCKHERGMHVSQEALGKHYLLVHRRKRAHKNKKKFSCSQPNSASISNHNNLHFHAICKYYCQIHYDYCYKWTESVYLTLFPTALIHFSEHNS